MANGGRICSGLIVDKTYEEGLWQTVDISVVSVVPITGCDFTSGNTCLVTMNIDRSVSAAFDLNQYTLTVTKPGTGSGIINGTGIDCGSDCTGAYAHGQVITLTASAEPDSIFGGWTGGGCSGTDICVVTITNDITVAATFDLLNPPPVLSTDEGTIGTHLTITGLGFGTKKGKVLIGGVATKIPKDGWKPDSITCTVMNVPLPPETAHDMTIWSKEIGTIPFSKAFTVKLPQPQSNPGVNDHGAPGDPITIQGNFFGTKKGNVHVQYLGKKKNCKVMDWGMTLITFLVPRKLVEGTYPLNITNKIGTVKVVDFTIDPPASP